MDLGPKLLFICTADSASLDSFKICHIIAQDVAYQNDKDTTNIFFTDKFISDDNENADVLAHWQKSLSNTDFRVKFLTLSIVDDLLQLNDTISSNAWNYGSIMQLSNNESQYKAVLVDFLIIDSYF